MKIIELCAIDQTMKIFLMPLCKCLIGQGFELTCVCSEGPYTEELKGEGLNIVNVPIERKIKPVSNIKSIYKLYKLFRSIGPDVLHVHSPVAAVLGRLAAKLAKVPIVIYTAHGFYFHDNMSPLKYKLLLNIEKHMARYFTDLIFTQSEEDRHTAIRNGFIGESRIVCIGNGVDVYGRFSPQNIEPAEIGKLKDEFKLADSDIIITFIGRLVSEKGIVELLDAFECIGISHIKLLVVGDVDQGCRDHNTKNLVFNKYKGNENIIFTGFRRDINNVLYITDIFCLPSYREGMPRTIIEAMAMECAVLATDIRGCREEVIEGKTGFLVKPQSPQDIRKKLEILIADEKLLKNMKVEGRKRAENYFDEYKIISKQIDAINALYEKYRCRSEADNETEGR